jgi:hypothetical protein
MATDVSVSMGLREPGRRQIGGLFDSDIWWSDRGHQMISKRAGIGGVLDYSVTLRLATSLGGVSLRQVLPELKRFP